VSLIAGRGIEGDAHAGPGLRQISLLHLASYARAGEKKLELAYGSFAGNMVVEGLDFGHIAIATQLAVGRDALLEVTQIGKTCDRRCRIYEAMGECAMSEKGVFARVLRGGVIYLNDPVRIIQHD
jgi:MOSC domain-containing protein YiiM